MHAGNSMLNNISPDMQVIKKQSIVYSHIPPYIVTCGISKTEHVN